MPVAGLGSLRFIFWWFTALGLYPVDNPGRGQECPRHTTLADRKESPRHSHRNVYTLQFARPAVMAGRESIHENSRLHEAGAAERCPAEIE